MLERVIDFVTDRDMQASSEVRIVMLDYLKTFQKHLDSGYVPSKDVQLAQDKLETAVKEFEESLMSMDTDDSTIEKEVEIEVEVEVEEIVDDRLIPEEDDEDEDLPEEDDEDFDDDDDDDIEFDDDDDDDDDDT